MPVRTESAVVNVMNNPIQERAKRSPSPEDNSGEAELTDQFAGLGFERAICTMRVTDLQDVPRDAGLQTNGVRSDLLTRLREFDRDEPKSTKTQKELVRDMRKQLGLSASWLENRYRKDASTFLSQAIKARESVRKRRAGTGASSPRR